MNTLSNPSRRLVWRLTGLIGIPTLLLTACGTHSNQPNMASLSTPATTISTTATAASSDTSEDSTSSESKAGISSLGNISADVQQQQPSDDAELVVTGVRLGNHGSFDRIVFDLNGTGTPGWRTEYTTSPTQQGSGLPLDYTGVNALNVDITGTLLPFELGLPDPQLDTINGTGNLVTGVTFGGTFEGRSQFAIGINKPNLAYSVQILSNPTRLVIDIVNS
ncbi:putative secreted protein [Corynebacterium kutscheri]|uniref:Secreted protein n=1 Tax=Corynebacterium kutscheri TaxID=35755 RepID=A0A0F6QYK9_9CORY|nr:hypothetical protein [Corynebacterium kutscheri]AKE40637.1 hypothetical protein UL82_02060 [Corynebacterium kutscheri]VEH04803.1 putative secreted protein [Corynebacterium kutscheri]VEH11034.1 putative secreted protein [Corynebacterium kutscheri]VEH80487.1 putative secreted protein [Corynebacterium kutscheri]